MIDPNTTMGLVSLRVADLDRALRLYETVLGFRVLERAHGKALLGAQDGVPLLELWERRDAPGRPPGTTGLYHFAVLVPRRADLGHLLKAIGKAGIRIGHADHLVSEALYLSDPDGNGIELYTDRPREEWCWKDGRVAMATIALDLRSLLDEADSDTAPWTGLPAGTRIGHVHLNVGDLTEAERFYQGVLGFDVTSHFPGALFVSAGGYHHHLGLNIWESPKGGPAPEGSTGLVSYTIALPDRAAAANLRERLASSGADVIEAEHGVETFDPWRNRIRIVTEAG